MQLLVGGNNSRNAKRGKARCENRPLEYLRESARGRRQAPAAVQALPTTLKEVPTMDHKETNITDAGEALQADWHIWQSLRKTWRTA